MDCVPEQLTTHATLMARLAGGADQPDMAAWQEFCDRYGELIRRFALRQNLQPADCDDVMQEVLLSLTQTMPQFRYDPARGRFRSFLKTVVLRSVFKRFRQKKAEGRQVDIEQAVTQLASDPETEQVWDDEWRQHHLRVAMNTVRVEFNRTDVAAFESYVGDGVSAQETAEALGMSVDQVYQAKSRIMKRLAQLIEQQTVEEG